MSLSIINGRISREKYVWRVKNTTFTAFILNLFLVRKTQCDKSEKVQNEIEICNTRMVRYSRWRILELVFQD